MCVFSHSNLHFTMSNLSIEENLRSDEVRRKKVIRNGSDVWTFFDRIVAVDMDTYESNHL